MTVRELYNWAIENNALDKDLCTVDGERGGFIWFDDVPYLNEDGIVLEDNYFN